ncbi:MAG: hypothetical protein Fur006_36130 [Coleofasciculaceae cyanobacterium]
MNLNDFFPFAKQARQELADLLSKMSQTLKQAESKGNNSSNNITLKLTDEIQRLYGVAQNLRDGKFKILVLGEFSRGKSSFINALLRELVLPAKTTPCTAFLTFIRYGKIKQAIIHDKDGKHHQVSIEDFITNYTIPDDAYNTTNENLFPNIDYAVIEYPLEVLKQGVEILDSPGLNEDPTKRRDQIVFEYIKACSSIIFVLSATQLLDEDERKYLENKIKGKNLPVFFLINQWDSILQNSLYPEVEEQSVRRRARGFLSEYLRSQDNVPYEKRVFEISARNVVYNFLKKDGISDRPIYEFPKFEQELREFLTKDRLAYELIQAVNVAQSISEKVNEVVERTIFSLGETVEELQRSIALVQPLFTKLETIKGEFQQYINQERKRCAKKNSDSYKAYIYSLQNSFYSDFAVYEPTLEGTTKSDAEKFCQEAESAFKRYLETKMAVWSREVEVQDRIQDSLKLLGNRYDYYALDYSTTTKSITQQLNKSNTSSAELSKGMTLASFSENANVGDITQLNINQIGAKSGAGWGALGGGYLGLMGGATTGAILSSIPAVVAAVPALPFLLTVVGIPLAIGAIWGAISGWQGAKEEFINRVKFYLREQLPQIADQQYDSIYSSVEECFSPFYELVDKMSNDIRSQKQQLNSLLEQKTTKEINVENEEKRLNTLKEEISSLSRQVTESYQKYTNMQT